MPNESPEAQSQQAETRENLAESFYVELGTAKYAEVIEAFRILGFRFLRQIPDQNQGTVTYEGERPDDGTEVKIIFKQGKDYLSPQEKALAEEEKPEV